MTSLHACYLGDVYTQVMGVYLQFKANLRRTDGDVNAAACMLGEASIVILDTVLCKLRGCVSPVERRAMLSAKIACRLAVA